MAHHSKPSLMSRLFPQEDRPAGQVSSEDFSSSTLFSAERALFGSSSLSSFQDEAVRRNDLFQACFASFSNATAGDRVQQDKAIEGDILTPIKSMSAIKPRQVRRMVLSLCATNAFPFAVAFAEEGMELHDSVRKKLLEAQRDINSKISDFETLSSAIVSVIDEIYANLSYPLSATLCSSAGFPSATIETHLASAKGQLKEAEKKLRNLQDEWKKTSAWKRIFAKNLQA